MPIDLGCLDENYFAVGTDRKSLGPQLEKNTNPASRTRPEADRQVMSARLSIASYDTTLFPRSAGGDT